MSKFKPLWEYIKDNKNADFQLSFQGRQNIFEKQNYRF